MRCANIYNGRDLNICKTIQKANLAIEEFTFAKENLITLYSISTRTTTPPQDWSPPTPPFVKINIDGSWNETNNHASLGVVIRDLSGN